MQYSPKLKTVIKQIEDLLKENDIAGFVVLHTPGYSEYLNHMQTSYSCAVVVPKGVRLKIDSSKVGIDRARELANGTYNMMTHLTKHIASHAVAYMDCEERLRKQWNPDHYEGGETSHNQQNN